MARRNVYVGDPENALRFNDEMARWDLGERMFHGGFMDISLIRDDRHDFPITIFEEDGMVTVFRKDFPAAVVRIEDLADGDIPKVMLLADRDPFSDDGLSGWRFVEVPEDQELLVPAGVVAFRLDAPTAFGGIGRASADDGLMTAGGLARELALSATELEGLRS